MLECGQISGKWSRSRQGISYRHCLWDTVRIFQQYIQGCGFGLCPVQECMGVACGSTYFMLMVKCKFESNSDSWALCICDKEEGARPFCSWGMWGHFWIDTLLWSVREGDVRRVVCRGATIGSCQSPLAGRLVQLIMLHEVFVCQRSCGQRICAVTGCHSQLQVTPWDCKGRLSLGGVSSSSADTSVLPIQAVWYHKLYDSQSAILVPWLSSSDIRWRRTVTDLWQRSERHFWICSDARGMLGDTSSSGPSPGFCSTAVRSKKGEC